MRILPSLLCQQVGLGLETLSAMTESRADLDLETMDAVLRAQLKVMKESALTVSNLGEEQV